MASPSSPDTDALARLEARTAELETQLQQYQADLQRSEAQRINQLNQLHQQLQTERKERQKAETTLRLWEQVIKASKSAIVIADAQQPDRPVIYVNPAFELQTGYTTSEVLGQNCRILQAGDRQQPELEKIRTALKQGEGCIVVLRNYRKDGTLYWNELNLFPIYDEQQQLTHFVGIQTDVSQRKQQEGEQKQAEAALRESEERLRLALESANMGAWDRDLIADRQVWSVQTEALFGFAPGTYDGSFSSFLKRVHPDDRVKIVTADLHNCPRDKNCQEYRVIHPDGSLHWVASHNRVSYNEAGQPVRMSGIAWEITEQKLAQEKICRSEAALAEAQRLARLGNWEFVVETQGGTWSDETFRMHGLPAGMPIPSYREYLKRYVHKGDRAYVRRQLHQILKSGQAGEFDFRFLRADGSMGYASCTGQPVCDLEGKMTRLFGTLMDISDRKQVEAELRQQQEHLRLILDNIPQQVFWKDVDLVFRGCNKNWAAAAECSSPEAVIGKTDYDFLANPEVADRFRSLDRQVMTTDTPTFHIVEQKQRPARDGSYIWLDISKIPIHDIDGRVTGILGVIEDITERRQAEEQLRNSLREKEILLKEIHHRVKNNLQIVSSLLRLQAGAIQDPCILAPFQESQNRIKAMALIHEKLYQSDSLAKLNFGDYIRNLARDLLRSYMSHPAPIHLELQVADLELAVDLVIPCGLIINELVSNAIKYAFAVSEPPANLPPDNQQITIGFGQNQNQHYVLTIADNGRGIPQTHPSSPQSLGLRLVDALVHQLRGNLVLDNTHGSLFCITFPSA